MSYEWGRAPEAGRWQRAVPVWLMSVMLIAVASGGGMWWIRQTFFWTPLQQFYLSAYVRSAVASSLALRTGRYRLLLMEKRRGTRLAIDEEVIPMSTSTGEATFALLWENCPRSDAVDAVRQVLQHVKAWRMPGPIGQDLEISLSAGVATLALPPKNFPPHQLIDAAQRCLSGVQLSGGNAVKSIEF